MTTPTSTGIVVIGAGQAAVQTAESLRNGGFRGPITLLGDEPLGPYHRPPLSKAWLSGELDQAQLMMRSPEALARKDIVLRPHCTVTAVDRAAGEVQLADGERLRYSGLVFATGATPRALPLPGAKAQGVLALRALNDAQSIAQRLSLCAARQRPVVVIGGGFIGLEVAATARKLGLTVTVLETAPRLMSRVLVPALSTWYADLHRLHGVSLELGIHIDEICHGADGEVNGVRLRDGRFFPAGLVVVGVGVVPNDQLARACGLECEQGIVVDAFGRTSDARIVAAGDCTARRLPGGQLLRLESVHNATEQGKCAAAALLEQPRAFAGTPWFWSDQYDKKLQIAGLSSGAGEWVVRGSMHSGSFSVYHFKDSRLIAVDSINAAKDHLQARKLLDANASPTLAQAQDPAFDLARVLTSAAR